MYYLNGIKCLINEVKNDKEIPEAEKDKIAKLLAELALLLASY